MTDVIEARNFAPTDLCAAAVHKRLQSPISQQITESANLLPL